MKEDTRHFLKTSRYWLLACAVVAVAYVVTVPASWQCEGVDEIEYLSIAHSMVLGEGYTVYGAPHVLYPPLFATWLSLLMRLFGVTAWRAMYVCNALFAVAGWTMIGLWMRTRFGRAGRWAAWLMLFSYYAWSFPCRFLMTEPVFLPISFGAIILAWRILERNRGKVWEYAAFGALCLLAGMTRAAAVSLNLGLVAAGGIRWLTTKRRPGLAVALLAFVLGVGFFAYWSARADIINPNAPESHWRWAKKYLGISGETEGIVAEGEELSPVSTSPWRRTVFWTVRYGQFITSVVRPPDNFLPLAAGLALIFVVGFGVHWQRRFWSPPAWYSSVFLSMILMTTWLSNYHRFLFVLAPFLFLFLLEGARRMYRWVYVEKKWWICLVLAAWGVWGILLTALHPATSGVDSGVDLYVLRMQAVLLAVYAGMIVIALWAARRRVPLPMSVQESLAAVVVVFLLIHSGALVFQRYRMTRQNVPLESRNLMAPALVARWMAENTADDMRGIATIPRLAAVMAGRRFAAPYYTADGELDVEGVDYVFVFGNLVDMPPYDPYQEGRLRAAAARAEKDGTLERKIAKSGAVVYEVKNFRSAAVSLPLSSSVERRESGSETAALQKATSE